MSLQTLPLDLLEKILSFCSSNDAARMLRMNQHLKAVISEILSSSYWTAKTIVERKFSIQSSAEVDQKSPFISEIARMFQAIVNGGSKDPRREVKDWFDKAYPVSITLKLNCTCLDAFHQRYDDDQDDDFVRCLGVYDRRSSLINSYPSYEQRETNPQCDTITIEVISRCIYQFKGEWIIGDCITKGTHEPIKEPAIISAEIPDLVSSSPFIHRNLVFLSPFINRSQNHQNQDIPVISKISANIPPTGTGPSPLQMIITNVPSPCTVTVTAPGLDLEHCGSYVASEEDWSYGRRLFKQTGGTNVLLVAFGGEWHLTIGDFNDFYAISAHEAPSLCPADPRAGRFEAWPELVVNCDVHHDLSPIHLRN